MSRIKTGLKVKLLMVAALTALIAGAMLATGPGSGSMDGSKNGAADQRSTGSAR
ncbi:hypothetical protein [Actinomadura sp. 21ATH]|uniref:hypothetical protein n=1 Tax=Actinomadura sp. 21ATH TaxID=1735444 RepID=UPI0035C1A529